MTWIVEGLLKPLGNASSPLPPCRVECFFRMLDAAKGDELFAGHASAASDESGHFALKLPERERVADERVRLVVNAPSGRSLAEVYAPRDSLGGDFTIEIDPPTPIPLGPASAPKQTPHRRLQARVVDSKGEPIVSRLQVVLFARAAEAHPSDPEQTILATSTDKAGYFFGHVPGTPFAVVEASVAGVGQRLPLRLENGFIAPKQILVADLAGEITSGGEHGCACNDQTSPPRMAGHEDIVAAPEVFSTDLGAGGCVQFNKPNRAIEEFDFYSVVRTTQPEMNVVGAQAASAEPPDGPPRREPATPVGDRLAISLGASAATDFAAEGVDALLTHRTAWIREQLTPGASFLQRELRVPSDAVVLRGLGFAFDDNQVRSFAVQRFRLVMRDRSEKFLDIDLTQVARDGSRLLYWAQIPADPRLEDVARMQVTRSAKGHGPANSVETLPVLGSFPARAYLRLAASPTLADDPRFVEMHFDLTLVSNRAAAGEGGNYELSGNIVRDETLLQLTVLPGDAGSQTGSTDPSGAMVSRPAPRSHTARYELNGRNPIDWDATPTFYEATTIAHGHLLHFKQIWYADGYSLGDLLYSLPLAPGQKRLISVLDWERRESSGRDEYTSFDEAMRAALSRDRDLGEVVSGALSESSRGGSRSTMGGIGVGIGGAANGSYQGINFGSLLGISGGYSDSSSSAWQSSARNLSSNSLQQLRDKTMQSASAVRTMRSTLVQTASQGESVRGTTEVVANHNHCHAITIQYFEVLRHLLVAHELVDVQECLFVPLPMSEFDRPKALRWRQSLAAYLKRPELQAGFDAARRVETAWADTDTPLGRYADEPVVSIVGELLLTVVIPLPPFPERPEPKPDQTAALIAAAVGNALDPTAGFLGAVLAVATGGASTAVAQGARAVAESLFAEPSADARFRRFQQEVMPGAVAGFVDRLEMHVLTPQGLQRLQGVELTLASTYQPGVPLRVSVRGALGGQLARSSILQVVIRSSVGLPHGCRAIVNAASLRYRSRAFENNLVDDRRVDDDIDLPRISISLGSGGLVPVINVTQTSSGVGVTLFTPLDAWEQRQPRKEDSRLAAELIEHLNDHLEYYHHALWWTMDPNRRYMLLDGVYSPNANGLSVASVVENRLIGIVGNSLVMPVARGRRLDPVFSRNGNDSESDPIDLLDYYKLDYPIPPTQVSLPTRGVFAEAVTGACNSCEEIDDSRFWRWEESPIDEPPAMAALSTDSRRSDPDFGKPTEFPGAIVAIQNAPSVPDPAGVKVAVDGIGKPFADMSGLAATQANAAGAFRQAVESAVQFGKEASALAQQAANVKSADKTLSTIDKAEAAGKITKDEAKELRLRTLRGLTGEPDNEDGSSKAEKDAAAEVVKKVPADRVTKVQTPGGTVVEAAPAGSEPQPAVAPATPRDVSLVFFTEDEADAGHPLFFVATLEASLGATKKTTTTRQPSVVFEAMPNRALKLTVDMVSVHLDNAGSIRWPNVPDWAESLRDKLNDLHKNFLGITSGIASLQIPAQGDQFSVKISGRVSRRSQIQRQAQLMNRPSAEQTRTVDWSDLMPTGATKPVDPAEVMRRLDGALRALSRACVRQVIDNYDGRVASIETIALITFDDPATSATIEVWPIAWGELRLVAMD
ncbi:MAG: hypothetical protein KF683_12540 [Rubrivivax sp.]|nr:hypothetical protein [Rubrivivax sp.]